jgi:hypothetical protein
MIPILSRDKIFYGMIPALNLFDLFYVMTFEFHDDFENNKILYRAEQTEILYTHA